MDFRLLGPVELVAGTVAVDLGPAKQRCVLAALAVQPGRPVPTELLIERVWGDGPPADARGALYSYLTRLRHTGVRIVRTDQGYVLDAAPDQVDLHRFTAGTDLDRALAEWRGEPLDGLSGDWVRRVRTGLHRQRVRMLAAWADAALARGRAAEVVERMSAALDDYPHAEPLIAGLLRGLHAQGRGAEALEQYELCRTRLRAELGAGPGADLRELHLRLLRDTAAPIVRPAQLPAAPRGFAGRTKELSQLSTMDGPVVICGLPGVGKTALALTWAHRIAHRFPDGALHADLRGEPGATEDVLAAFLRALGAAGPPDPARYQALLAGRRVLVLLDNVADARSVRPLLPGGRCCRAVLTSRDPLPELVGAQRIRLGPLPVADAVAVLADRLGAERIAEDRAAAEEVARLCDGLPLALRIAAARLLDHPGYGLAAYAKELREGDRLGELETEDAAIRTAFDAAVRRLPEPHHRVFRLLGAYPGGEFTAARAAALAGLDVTTILPALVAAGLLEDRGDARFGMPELLRHYAVEDQARAR